MRKACLLLCLSSAFFFQISAQNSTKPAIDMIRDTLEKNPSLLQDKGKTYAVIIGINKYPNFPQGEQLKNAVSEARRLKKALERYNIDSFIELYDENATGEAIQSLFTDWLMNDDIHDNDDVLIFFAGHGTITQNGRGPGYWQAYDAIPDRPNAQGWILNSFIRDWVKSSMARHVLIVADCCYAGSLLDGSRGNPIDTPQGITDAFRLSSREVIVSALGTKDTTDNSKFGEILNDFLEQNTNNYVLASQIIAVIEQKMHPVQIDYGQFSMDKVDRGGHFILSLKQVIANNETEAQRQAEIQRQTQMEAAVKQAEAELKQAVERRQIAETAVKQAEERLQAAETAKVEYFEWKEEKGVVTIMSYTGSEKDISVPTRINGMPVTSIGAYAFYEKQLTSVSIPNGIISIEENAFAHNNLSSVSIPNGIISIEENAFAYNDLSSVAIPHSVISIGGGAFHSNRKLTSITVGLLNKYYIIVDDILFNKEQTLLHTVPAGKQLTTYTIPKSVTSIEAHAFCDNYLKNIVIPNSVTSIGTHAFCRNQLTNFYIPNSVTFIGYMAFDNDFNDFYDNNNKKAGTYTWDGSKWSYK